jgi:spermidine synthase
VPGLLHALFFVSGACGLVYEVVWVRQLGNVFGNTVYSAALVTAVFMGGLGLGSYGAGDWIDRRLRRDPAAPLRAYGVAELTIAAWALGLALLLPRLPAAAARLTSYRVDAAGWNEVARGVLAVDCAFAAALLFVPTLLMGATFTLLVRHALRAGIADVGWRIGTLYGANTAGAALGAFATDWALVPGMGLLGTQIAAVAAQVAVGGAAVALARADAHAHADAHADADADADAGLPPRALAACAALFVSGFAALGMELSWFRGLSASLGAYRAVFSIVLALLLVGIWLGSVAGGWAHRRWGRPTELFVVSQALFALLTLACVATFARPPGAPYDVALAASARVVALPAILMGFSMPLAQAVAQDSVARAGHRAGALYLANTAGSVAGSLFAGFVLAPRLGTQTSLVVLAACAAAAPLPLVLTAPDRRSPGLLRAVAAGVALSVPAIGAWLALPPTFVLARFLPPLPEGERALALREGVNEVVVVTEAPDGSRRLVTNGFPMSATKYRSARYMRAFAHVPLLMMERPESALVICFGVGSTLHATSLHGSLARIDLADLSKNVLEHAPFFRMANHDVLRDPRVHVYVNDGRQHLETQPEATYDLVTLEPPPITFAGVSALYSREFYELAKSRLKPGGLMTQWLPIYQSTPDHALAAIRAFVEVFPQSALLAGYGTELVLIGAKDTLLFDPARVAERLAAEPRVAEDLARMDMGTLTELAGTFLADANALRRATDGVGALTDDRPVLEYTVPPPALDLPKGLFDFDGLASFCPACAKDARASGLAAYEAALTHVYPPGSFASPGPDVGGDAIRAAIAESGYLRRLFGPPGSP